MDILGQPFDDYHSCSLNSSETASSSNNPSNTYEEVILASSKPKKRAGRRIFKETRHPVYRGVRKRNNNKWVCEVRVPNSKSRRIWLGTYATPEMAARAHDVAALALRGKAACLNFADSAWRLPLPASADALEIRRAAAEAAEIVAVEDGYNRPQIADNAVIDYEVCSSETVGVVEDAKRPLIGLCLDQIRGVSEFEDVHDWLRSMAEEPLRSPPPFVRYGHYREWNDVEADAEVSLWSFTI